MKRRSHPVGRSGIAPYSRYGKRPFDYSTGYHEQRKVLAARAREAELVADAHRAERQRRTLERGHSWEFVRS